VLVRKLVSADLNQLLALYKHLHAQDDPLPEQSVVNDTWAEIMANPRSHYFGGFVDDVLVSSCALTVIPNLTRGCRPYGIIENVVTNANYQRRGYATALLTAALTHAWSNNCYKVMLLTGRKDEATLRFYEAAGFDRHGKQAFIAKPAD